MRYTLGQRIDALFIETLELILSAGYAPRENKFVPVARASQKLDTLKLLLQCLWEIKALDTKKYARVATPLVEVGKMLGGWQKQLNTTPPAG